uniref:Eukaryotic translation initiation factor 3 subunit K-like n=1 Tax=Sinocyclocheilus anshuiensis TaxID=1608454 RepID=A0A671RB58_9TELE
EFSSQEERPIRQILYLGNLLETCHFQSFWASLEENRDLIDGITGFEDSVRKFICHVVGITYQNIEYRLLAEMLGDPLDTQVKVWMNKYGWTENEDGQIFIHNQEESVKPKNIVEKIDFESEFLLMTSTSGCNVEVFVLMTDVLWCSQVCPASWRRHSEHTHTHTPSHA